MMMNDKIALVTGAASGIGRATAIAFAREGAQLVISDVDKQKLRDTAELVREAGAEVLDLKADISSEQQIKRMVAETVDRFGQLDFACNNAGIEGEQGITSECTSDNWSKVIDINLQGTWLCMKYEIAEMLKGGGGAIVNISSIAGLIGFPGIPAYVSSKHGINGLTKTAALEYAGQGIRVNAICPGAIQTPMIDRFVGEETEERQNLVAQHPMGRMGRPEEVAEAVVWLCSEKASFVTGQTLAVDGGYMAQ
ncbi:SDR family oxidoreductase [Fodinibius salsisoli]|uniref:SDR family oxidoreductase n=1 Tax=Fodinibius salsisoli TaxID=2820877 RepID=A0ABT3PIU5_9BACT|nr:SDR family oxidoreductase [Fodinibius salsisoli]MCW9705855.1 SDR family oxidoreductase [Fodinibius salsisoli]